MYLYMDIVEAFSCRCCGECCRRDWLVTVDEKSYWRNHRLFREQGWEKDFVDSFQLLEKPSGIGEFAAVRKDSQGQCLFLTEENRCRLHETAGHEHLDVVCQTYPRYPMNTARGIELTLSFSCPAVMDLVCRAQPLRIIRDDERISWGDGYFTAEVHPLQKPVNHPLRRYFELEQHVIDILQWRKKTVEQRLTMVEETLGEIENRTGDIFVAAEWRDLLETNYRRMEESETCFSEEEGLCTGAILLEHFLVNWVFKKILYIHGFSVGLQLLREASRKVPSGTELKEARKQIMDLELQYNHHRQSLLQKLTK